MGFIIALIWWASVSFTLVILIGKEMENHK